MTFRPYDPEKDQEAAHRVFREAGWIGRSSEQEQVLDAVLAASNVMVAELEGSAECLVACGPATIRYLDEDLPMCAVMEVLTSHVARKRGLASRLTARQLERGVASGAIVAALGMFEQGYYDRLGFGTGAYEHLASFDPAQLRTTVPHRVPCRLGEDDWQEVHAARLARTRRHGAVNILLPETTRGALYHPKGILAYGYRDGPGGAVSHCLCASSDGGEHGPYFVRFIAYRTARELLELVALLQSLGDQVHLVRMFEPPGIQMQDLLEKPFKQHDISERSPYEAGIRAVAWSQARLLDLPACLARTHLPGPAVRFNLRLRDPIERYLEADAAWRGVGGDYVVELGPSSGAERGSDPSLPTLTATVNAFTRLWLGVVPATGLAITDDLAGPDELLAQLEAALRLPVPQPGWQF
ncbi:MAG: GNAT family N-acetyltransferase [Anaerolineae bacterium]|nr:GNAT family N-acetyltransferase [Anaerolineae bacterium]